MILDKNILKTRSFQLVALMIGIQIYLIIEQIVPAYEKIPYYESKIETSKQERANLEINGDHLVYYQKKKVDSESKLEGYKAHLIKLRKPGYLQSRLNSIFQETGLEVISQQLNTDENNSELTRILISFSLKGKYNQVAKFLKKAAQLDQFATISEFELINDSPISTDPSITLNIILIAFFPKLS